MEPGLLSEQAAGALGTAVGTDGLCRQHTLRLWLGVVHPPVDVLRCAGTAEGPAKAEVLPSRRCGAIPGSPAWRGRQGPLRVGVQSWHSLHRLAAKDRMPGPEPGGEQGCCTHG